MMEIKDLADLEILKECLSETDLVLPEDKKIICKDCGKEFIFTIGEQEFYKSKNFADPQRCRKCSKKRRLKFLKYK